MTMTMIKTFILFLFISSCSSSQISEAPGEYLNSFKITAKIRKELIKRKGLEGFKVKIITIKSQVFLSGNVDYLQQKLLAEELARSTKGVLNVTSKITINAERL